MMDFFNNLNFKTSNVLKVAGLAILAIVVVAVGLSLVSSSFNSIAKKSGVGNYVYQDMARPESASDGAISSKYNGAGSVSLSARNVISAQNPSAIYREEVSSGDTAEAFEVTEYYANIETRKLEDTCKTVADLKAREDVIFENASNYDKGCNFVFKAKRDKTEEILAVIKKLNPKDLAESIYTIKEQIDDYTSQTEILEKKLASIDETLNKALSAYDEVARLATGIREVEVLAKVIDSRINVIERLTQERLNINSQLDMIQRSKAEQIDRLAYTVFRVNIVEDKFIDGENLVDSWKSAIKKFVYDVNRVIQDVSVNLVTVLLRIFQYVLYLLILLVVAKYGWQLVKYIWRK